ncbi:PepSY domain-containing protein [Chelatococcus reniformis]|uniref:PepSY domain-containing protein n=1 Tax=Chelatococcus reniformis TaxID=1494448 RepID=A0A916ULF2_9HYPH|nr:PepSY domain-containing protein [Chelatococcus reniformis]GGC76735.1 hypothetical protein GCM10010994_38790 [Chelatococcus reniformis]
MRILLASVVAMFVGTAGAAWADVPGADWMPAEQVKQKLAAAGYSDIYELEADDGRWEGEGLKAGQRLEFHADARTGAILSEKPDRD